MAEAPKEEQPSGADRCEQLCNSMQRCPQSRYVMLAEAERDPEGWGAAQRASTCLVPGGLDVDPRTAGRKQGEEGREEPHRKLTRLLCS